MQEKNILKKKFLCFGYTSTPSGSRFFNYTLRAFKTGFLFHDVLFRGDDRLSDLKSKDICWAPVWGTLRVAGRWAKVRWPSISLRTKWNKLFAPFSKIPTTEPPFHETYFQGISFCAASEIEYNNYISTFSHLGNYNVIFIPSKV